MTKFERIIKTCRDLRAAFERDEARFLIGLADVEEANMDELKANGCPTFATFLESYALCSPSRYAEFSKGLARIDRAQALSMGTNAVIALARLVNPKAVPKYVEAVEAFKADTGGVCPSAQTSRKLLRQVDPRAEVPRGVQRMNDLSRALAENQELRAELAAAKKRIRELEKELAKAGRRRPPREGSRAEA